MKPYTKNATLALVLSFAMLTKKKYHHLWTCVIFNVIDAQTIPCVLQNTDLMLRLDFLNQGWSRYVNHVIPLYLPLLFSPPPLSLSLSHHILSHSPHPLSLTTSSLFHHILSLSPHPLSLTTSSPSHHILFSPHPLLLATSSPSHTSIIILGVMNGNMQTITDHECVRDCRD